MVPVHAFDRLRERLYKPNGMKQTIKNCIHRTLARFGYRLVKSRAASGWDGQAAFQAPAELIAALPGIIRQLQPVGLPPLEGYQLEMATYDLKTGMGDADPTFFPLYERCRQFTMTSWQRLYSLHSATKYVVNAGIPGDFVECGVWRGGSMMMAAHTLLSLGQTDRRLFLFDTFEGLPKPDEQHDVDVWGNSGLEAWEPHRTSDTSSKWAFASLEEVRANMESTGYPMDKVFFVKGMVEQTIPANSPENISMLRLDTDWYESTKHELEHLYPRLAGNGILIIDDYGHFMGARKAVDEYFAKQKVTPLLTRVDYAGRIAVKFD